VRGVGVSHAAISVVNALPLGIGAAIGIEWPARVTARLPSATASRGLSVDPTASRTRLVRESARAALDRFRAADGGLRLSVRTTIPVARGLKSSSAVSSAVILATARAAGTEPSPEAVARLAATVGRATGVSATGAYDDAIAGLVAGGVVTDNRRDTELRRLRIDPRLAVALWIPARSHPPSPSVQKRFRRSRDLARRAIDQALAGDWVQAMAANSSLVEEVLGYRYRHLHERVARAGAVASGVSGLGPTFAVLAPPSRLRRVLAALPPTGRRRSVRLYGDPRRPTRRAL
jgi:shikimate kinase